MITMNFTLGEYIGIRAGLALIGLPGTGAWSFITYEVGPAILREVIFKILIGFGGSFSDKWAFPGGHFIHFIKVVQCSDEYELKLNVTAEERIKLYPLLNSRK